MPSGQVLTPAIALTACHAAGLHQLHWPLAAAVLLYVGLSTAAHTAGFVLLMYALVHAEALLVTNISLRLSPAWLQSSIFGRRKKGRETLFGSGAVEVPRLAALQISCPLAFLETATCSFLCLLTLFNLTSGPMWHPCFVRYWAWRGGDSKI